MRRTATVVLILAAGHAACSRPPEGSAKTPLPTRETTIDPVKQKLDAAAKDAERRREDIDNSAK